MRISAASLLLALLSIWGIPVSIANEGKCNANHKSMLQSGVVNYEEVVLDRPIEEVWAVLPEYFNWSPNHDKSIRKTITGERGKVGEVVEITLRSAADHPIYAETVRIRPPHAASGLPKAGNIVWKVYDDEICFSRFSDFGVWEYSGKTVFSHSVYEEISPMQSDDTLVFGEQSESSSQSRRDNKAELKHAIEVYIDMKKGREDEKSAPD